MKIKLSREQSNEIRSIVDENSTEFVTSAKLHLGITRYLEGEEFKEPKIKYVRGGIIKMRTDCDCVVACLAMIMNWSYEEALKYFPPVAVKETGIIWSSIFHYLRKKDIYFTCYKRNTFHLIDWDLPAMIDLPSLTAPDKGDHVIYWNGKEIIDPSNKKLLYKSDGKNKVSTVKKPLIYPDEFINEVYQIKK